MVKVHRNTFGIFGFRMDVSAMSTLTNFRRLSAQPFLSPAFLPWRLSRQLRHGLRRPQIRHSSSLQLASASLRSGCKWNDGTFLSPVKSAPIACPPKLSWPYWVFMRQYRQKLASLRRQIYIFNAMLLPGEISPPPRTDRMMMIIMC